MGQAQGTRPRELGRASFRSIIEHRDQCGEELARQRTKKNKVDTYVKDRVST